MKYILPKGFIAVDGISLTVITLPQSILKIPTEVFTKPNSLMDLLPSVALDLKISVERVGKCLQSCIKNV